MIIGLCGNIGSGKKTLYKCLSTILGEKIERFSPVDNCKCELNDFLVNQTGISAYSNNPIINDIILAYFNLKKNTVSNKYWTDLLEINIRQYDNIPVVIDILYEDECKWIKDKSQGYLIHVSLIGNDSQLIQNNKKMMEISDYKLVWETTDNFDYLCDVVKIQLKPLLEQIR